MFNIQRSFAAGEIAPALYGRADVARFATALRTCRNFVVRKEGGVKNRTGTQFITEVLDSSKATRLLKFVFNDEQTYVLEFGDEYIRFIKEAAQVIITAPSAWSGATTYAKGELVSSSGVNYYSLQGSNLNKTPASEPTYWYALDGLIYEIPSPYAAADLFDIKYEQSGDVLTLTHPSYEPYELSRTGDTAWSLDIPTLTSDPFTGSNDYPSTVTFFQQRRVFARTNSEPEDIFPSKVGDFYEFTTGTNAADAFQFTLAGRGINQVQHLVGAGGKFVALTTGGAWLINGGSDGTLTPTAINARQHGYDGAGDIRPVVIGSRLLYEQKRGSIIREIQYNFNEDGLQGQDLTIYSSHLFNGHSLVSMDYQHAFDTVLWCVRDDGVLLGLTYLPEQEVVGWHRHDTDGEFEDVCVVPEGNYDAVYVIVKRTIDGNTKRYIERFADQFLGDIDDARFMDSWLAYDGTNDTATTITASGSAWTSNDTVTLTASGSLFAAGDVGNAFVMTAGGETRTFRVTAYTSGTVVSARPTQSVPVALRAVATAVWSKAVDELSGLDHLEGATVAIIADGGVVDQEAVTSGSVTISTPASKIVVGIPIQSEVELLDIERPDGMTLIDTKKQVVKVKMLVESSRGIKASIDEGSTFDVAYPTGFVNDDYSAIPELTTGVIEVPLSPTWNDHGRVIIRQDDPLPLTILSAAPVVNVGGSY